MSVFLSHFIILTPRTPLFLGGHDNTERGYLPTLRKKLQDSLSNEDDGPFEVVVSTKDRHPLEIV